ncbi:MAG: hypothetical protein ACRBK7_11210 [Acidimicrobiales bacterium]
MIHTWIGVAGPRPTIVSVFSVTLVALMFAHFIIDLPSWWPFVAGGAAIFINIGLAYWQAGSFRVVAVTESGIQVFRKARWSTECTHLLGSMPRMPLGPLDGRWCRSSIANTMIWVNRKYHPDVAAFDADYLGRYGDGYGSIKSPKPVRIESD